MFFYYANEISDDVILFATENGKILNKQYPGCKESGVRQPGASGFCNRASEFCA